MSYCSNCGKENTSESLFCIGCGSVLIKPEYFNLKAYHDFNQLLTEENKKALEEMSFSIPAYQTILRNIENQAKSSYEDLLEDIPQDKRQSMDILSKIALITLAFTKISYKSRGAELGSYSFNLINIDDRLDKANQISALIHELTHHIVAEIYEQALMYILEAKKTDVLEAFVWFALVCRPTAALMDEYCAHTVQGRFIPHGYQNYGSFNHLLGEHFDPKKKEDRNAVHSQLVIGNSLAEDIIRILESFITPQLREEIKEQFKKDFNYPPSYDQILLETEETLPYQVKVSIINIELDLSFEIAMENLKDGRLNELLNDFKKSFFLTNQTFRRDADGFI